MTHLIKHYHDNKYISKDSESKIIHQNEHSNYYILFDSICDVDQVLLTLVDLTDRVVSEKEISTMKLYEDHQKRIKEVKANQYRADHEKERACITELKILNENPKDFLYVLTPLLFDNRYNEVFLLRLEYVLDSGKRIKTKVEKVRFTSCSE